MVIKEYHPKSRKYNYVTQTRESRSVSYIYVYYFGRLSMVHVGRSRSSFKLPSEIQLCSCRQSLRHLRMSESQNISEQTTSFILLIHRLPLTIARFLVNITLTHSVKLSRTQKTNLQSPAIASDRSLQRRLYLSQMSLTVTGFHSYILCESIKAIYFNCSYQCFIDNSFLPVKRCNVLRLSLKKYNISM